MHASLTELLENLKPGLLWVSREGVVRYANGDATERTGLAIGRKLYDPDLSRAVSATVAAKVPRAVNAMGRAQEAGAGAPDLACRVIPGLSADDAFVLIKPEDSANHGAAFDNLLQVVRSDLREPLGQANAALTVARNDPADAHGIDALCRSVDEVLRTLDKLVDLASVWGSSSLLANDRIELWPMLQQVWSEVEPLAMENRVKVRFRSQGEVEQLATLYGSEPWLKRVFLECMESAVRASKPGATLDVEHRQMGPRALVVFRDCGMFAPAVTGSVDMPSAARKPKAPTLHVRDQIGLKLCQHVVSLHGGVLRDEDEFGVRNFLIDLPTGAPHRNEQTQLDIAQAQKYAHDLAELMARARTSKRAASAT